MIIAANFKQYLSPEEEKELVLEYGRNLRVHVGQEVWIFPSVYSLHDVTELVHNLVLPLTIGSQDMAPALDQSQTGGNRADFFPNELVLIGHSERRKIFHEKIPDIKKKIHIALDTNKRIVLCLGEKKKMSDEEIIQVLKDELAEYSEVISQHQEKIIIAYEPWWAIGGTKTPTVQTIKKVASFLQKQGFAQVLYGGSVDANTVTKIVCPELSGFLIGRASITLPTLQAVLDRLANK